MTSKEIREIAERWHNAKDERYLGSTQDALSLADYILANVQEDGEEAVDEAWLREEWGFDSVVSGAWNHKELTGTFCFENDSLSWWHVGNRTATVSTRSQFRSLMAGLNVEPEKISQKNIKTS